MAESTLKKTAFVAVGIPVDFASRVRERLSSARTTFEDLRDRLTDEAREAFESWAEEGEHIVESMSERARAQRETWEDVLREKADILKDIGKSATVTLTRPIVPVADIDGIGPSYAERLARAGVISTRALVERCDTPDGIARLADQAGISATLLEHWATSADLTRIDGVGAEHMSLLNAVGVASVEMLAESDPADLRSRATRLHEDVHIFDVIPSETTFAKWIAAAKGL